jgi:hypothetical protein
MTRMTPMTIPMMTPAPNLMTEPPQIVDKPRTPGTQGPCPGNFARSSRRCDPSRRGVHHGFGPDDPRTTPHTEAG